MAAHPTENGSLQGSRVLSTTTESFSSDFDPFGGAGSRSSHAHDSSDRRLTKTTDGFSTSTSVLVKAGAPPIQSQESLFLLLEQSRIEFSSSFDPDHAPNSMLDRGDFFWVTTGLYPQQFCIQLHQIVRISRFQIRSINITKISIEYTSDSTFVHIADVDLADLSDFYLIKTKTLSFEPVLSARAIRITILGGLDDFVGIYQIDISGQI